MVTLALLLAIGQDTTLLADTPAEIWSARIELCERLAKEGKEIETAIKEIQAQPNKYGSANDTIRTCGAFQMGQMFDVSQKLDEAVDRIRREAAKAGKRQ